MSLASLSKKKTSSGGLAGLAGLSSPKTEPFSDLTSLAKKSGLGEEAQEIVSEKPKLSFLQRLSKGLGSFNPAEAILTGQEKGVGAGISKYATGIAKGLGSAITGRDIEGERRTFSDVAEKLGIDNGIAKFGLGFVGDVLLDPSTYFGGVIARGILGATKGATNVALKGVGKVIPEVETGLRMAGTGLQDALGRAFQYGYKSSEGAREDVLGFLSKEQRARVGLASSNLNRLGTGVLNKSQREELALKMIAGKRAEFTARQAGKTAEEAGQIARETALSGTTPEVSGVIESQISRSKKLGADIGLENPYETYFPFIKKEKLNRFLNESRGIKVGSEGYRKQFKNLLTNENLELDPAKAFFTREAQVVSDNMTRDFLDGFVKKYGKGLDEFKNVDDALKNDYVLLREKGNFGKEIGYVPKQDGALIRDSISPEFQTINMLAKATGFDALTSLFKRSVTGLFAPFHVRNFVSGNIQNFEKLGIEAFNPKNIMTGQKIALLMAKDKKVGGEFGKIFKPFVERFSGDTFYNTDFNLALKNGGEMKDLAKVFSKERIKETIKTAGLGTEAIPFKIGRSVGQFIEHQQKATAYITALNQGKSIPQALKIAEEAGFDYRALTRFESQILRRLIPFYSFTRKNLELQLKTLGENPQRINQVLSFFENVSEVGELSKEEKQALPDYLKEQLTVNFGKNKLGQPIVAGGFGTPIEQPGQVDSLRKILTSLNPLIKAPLERAFGKDFFQDRPIKEIVDAKQYQILPDFVKDFIGFREVKKKDKNGVEYKAYTAEPEKLHILRNLPTTRLFNYLYEIYRPEQETIPGAKALNLFTGIKPKPIDLETVKYFRDKKKQTELEELLIRAGILKEFRKTYEPK